MIEPCWFASRAPTNNLRWLALYFSGVLTRLCAHSAPIPCTVIRPDSGTAYRVPVGQEDASLAEKPMPSAFIRIHRRIVIALQGRHVPGKGPSRTPVFLCSKRLKPAGPQICSDRTAPLEKLD